MWLSGSPLAWALLAWGSLPPPGPCVPSAFLDLRGCHEARVCRGVAGRLRTASAAQGLEGSSAPDQQDSATQEPGEGPHGLWLRDSLLMDLESESPDSGRSWGWGQGAKEAESPLQAGGGEGACRSPLKRLLGLQLPWHPGWGLLWSLPTAHAPLTPAAPHPSQARSVGVWPWVPTQIPESRSSLSKAVAIVRSVLTRRMCCLSSRRLPPLPAPPPPHPGLYP